MKGLILKDLYNIGHNARTHAVGPGGAGGVSGPHHRLDGLPDHLRADVRHDGGDHLQL